MTLVNNLSIVLLCFLWSGILRAQKFLETDIAVFTKMKENYGNAVADFDLDGDLDVFIVAHKSFSSSDDKTFSRLLENKGGRFEDVTIEAGFSNQHFRPGKDDLKLGASWGDFNNDGYPDLLLAHQNGTQLYRNQGDGTFIDVTGVSGITSCTLCNNSSGLWWDFDNDGDLDLYLNYLDVPNRLYRNLGDETFIEINGAFNLNDSARTWSSLPLDVNHDGWMDLYVVNDFGLSKLYINQHGSSFSNETSTYNLENKGCGMGSAIGDYNNDGNFDIYVTNIAEFISNPLFMGSSDGTFENKYGVEGVGNGDFGWGTKFLDVDNDGDQDLYIVNGHYDLNYNNVFFKNLRSEDVSGFQDWSVESEANGEANGMGCEVFDYDNDGDLDILVSNTNNSPYLYKNQSATANSWLQIDLEGVESNRDALGAEVMASTNGIHKYRLNFGANMMGQSIKPIHFGLGHVERIDSLTIYWPSGKTEKIFNVDKNQKIKILENEGMIIGEIYTGEEIEEIEEIEEEKDEEESIIFKHPYPNPFSETTEFSFNVREAGLLSINIYTLSGVNIFSKNHIFTEPMDWKWNWKGHGTTSSKLPIGLYLYSIQLGSKKWNGKLILQ